MALVDNLGLTTHPEKSVLIPFQCIEIVGFLINSADMTVRLCPRKALDIKNWCIHILGKKQISIWEFAQLIGKMVAAEPGIQYAALHYKSLKIERNKDLVKNHGQFDAVMELSKKSVGCIHWWINNVETCFWPISVGLPIKKIETDSSLSGYGGVDLSTGNELSGHWEGEDLLQHINYLELKAAFLCLQAFCSDIQDCHIQLFLDNTVAIKYLTKMGGRNSLASDIWLWCEKRSIWLTVFHISGKLNVWADTLSRVSKKLNSDMEWTLSHDIFLKVQNKLGHCHMDLFASSENHKLPLYVSYLPDSNTFAVKAFSLQWKELNYAFPPFSLLGPIIKKVNGDNAELLVTINSCPFCFLF